ncbi:MAG: DnaJ domain-containing protein [Nitrospirae bacterium]|nr:DnaJ domain-containing protein [Nitrospirota bacterium]
MPKKELRLFNRYTKDSGVELKFRKKYFSGRLTNYSLDGASAVFDRIIPVGKGDIVELSAEDPGIKISGEVVWSMIERSSLKIGVKNVMRVKGFSKDFRFSDTLIGLQRGRKTGVLTFEAQGTIKKIFIVDGDIVYADSNSDSDRLGNILLREGVISSEQFDQSVTEQNRTGQKQGMILVRLGYIDPTWVITAEKYRVEEIIRSIFLMEEGVFSLEERPLSPEEVIPLKLSAASLIYYGVKGIKNPARINEEVPSLDSIPHFSDDPLSLFQDLRLDLTGQRVISLIDGRTSIREILSNSSLDKFETLKTIYALINTRFIELRDDSGDFDVPQNVIEEIIEEKAEPDQRKVMEKAFSEIIEDTHRRYKGLGCYEILGVNGNASVAEIKTAYYKAAKKFHPDMHFYLSDRSLKGKLSDIFSYVYEAYKTLSDPAKRKEYDGGSGVRSGRIAGAGEKARSAFEEGTRYFNNGDFQEAERLFGQASYYSGAAEHHYYYGLSLARQNKFKSAANALEKAHSLDPSNAEYISELGFVYLGLGLPKRARGLFEKALKIAPDNARALEGMKLG